MTPGATDDQDRADMIRLSAGHDDALNDLMDRHGKKLFHYLARALQSEDDAADLAQETFCRVYQSRAKYNPRQKFSTWLYAIATNLVKDRYRYRTRHPQVSLDAENAEMADVFARPAARSPRHAQRNIGLHRARGNSPPGRRSPARGASPAAHPGRV